MGTPIDPLQQIRLARKRGRRSQRTEPRAWHARYNSETRELELLLRDGRRVVFPVDQLEGLEGRATRSFPGSGSLQPEPGSTGRSWT